MEKKVRLRFAPSPTGALHIGGVRTALFNYLFAKKHNGDFILRIEDTDQNRYVEGAEKYIIESLKWCNINFDEGVGIGGDFAPYRQSERKKIYKKYADKLLKENFAYYAFDTSEELEKMRADLRKAKVKTPQYNGITRLNMRNSLTLSADEVKKLLDNNVPYVIRIKIPRNEKVKIYDIIRGWVEFHSSKLDDKVIFKSDGMPTYHLANVVDDHLMKISHVIRGEEWLPSLPTHKLLYQYLGWEKDMPEFAHLPLLLKPNGKGKLSKRDGDKMGFPVFPLRWEDPKTKEISSGYKEDGYFSDAFVNMLAFLGWNPGTTKELFSMEELIKEFSLERVGKSGSKFDHKKAEWFNQNYLKRKSNEELTNLFQVILKEKNHNFSDEYVSKVCNSMKDRAVFIKDFWEQASYFFKSPTKYDKKVIKKKWKKETPEILNELKIKVQKIENFNKMEIEKVFKNFLEEKNLKMGQLLNVFRLALTGLSFGPSIFEICELIKKEEVINRIEKSIEIIKK